MAWKGMWIVVVVFSVAMGSADSFGHEAREATGTEKRTGDRMEREATNHRSIYDFTMKDIDGEPVELAHFKGQVLLIVNTASKCGFTPQYAGLQSLYETYKDRGFSVLAFPANEFGRQEPGTNEEIKAFCKTNYDVTFPLFSKIVVKGEGQHPLYRYLTDEQPTEKFRGDIPWNFTKFLVGRDGTTLARFESKVEPQSDELLNALERALEDHEPDEGGSTP